MTLGVKWSQVQILSARRKSKGQDRRQPAWPFALRTAERMLGAEAPAEVRGGRSGGSCQPDHR